MENKHDMNQCECYQAGLQDGTQGKTKRRFNMNIIFNSDSSFRSSTTVKVSKEELSMYQTMFSMFDKDGDGTIDTKELGTLLRSLGKGRSHLTHLIKYNMGYWTFTNAPTSLWVHLYISYHLVKNGLFPSVLNIN